MAVRHNLLSSNAPRKEGKDFAVSQRIRSFAARIIKILFNQKQGNEQLRIDGDFYPCAV